MKKFILTIAALVLAAGFINAQDLSSATDTYNNGAEQLSMGKKAEALAAFQEALTLGEACGEDGADLVTNCKNAIPAVMLSLGKDLLKEKKFDDAIAKLNDAIAKAKEYGNDSVLSDATDLLPTFGAAKAVAAGTAAFTAKDYAGAATSFKEALAADPKNGAAALRLVQCLSNLGDFDAAKEALATAVENGQGDNAKKVLGGALLKQAAASLKAGKSTDAIAQAVEAAEYAQTAQAYLIAGQAATKANKSADAIKYYEQYVAADPTAKNVNAIIFTVGALYQQAGNKAKALENYKKVLTDPVYGAQAKPLVEALSK